jgi:hypothetical protein
MKMLSKKKEKFSLRHCTGVPKRLARRGGFAKKPLSKKKEKFFLRHCTGVPKRLARRGGFVKTDV